MSLSISNTTFTGEFAGRFINAAFLTARTIAMGGVKKYMNIKFRQVIQNLDASEVIDFSSCDYDDNVTLTTNEVILEPVELQTNLTLCKQEFHNDWQSKYQFMSAKDNVPANFQVYLLGYIGGLIGSGIESTIWRGNYNSSGTTNLSRFNGFATLLSDAAAGTRVGGGGVNASTAVASGALGQLPATQDLTSASTGTSHAAGQFALTQSGAVKGALKQIVDAIPTSVYSKSPSMLMLYLGLDTVRSYVDSLGTVNNGINDQQTMWWKGGFQGLTFNGLPVFVANGLSDATVPTAIATYKDNLCFGTGLLNDMNQATVIDRASIDGSRNVRIVWRYTAGTQIGNIRDCVYYARVAHA